MYSLSKLSSMPERTSRMIAATWNHPMAMTGMIICSIPPLPEAGSQPNSTDSTHMSISPIQKEGDRLTKESEDLARVIQGSVSLDRR